MSTSSATARLPRYVLIAAWIVPVMVATGFALLSLIPVAIVIAGTLRDERLWPLGWWSAGLAAVYLPPLIMWAVGPDRAPSLTKDMSLPMTLIVIAVAATAAVRLSAFRLRNAQARAKAATQP